MGSWLRLWTAPRKTIRMLIDTMPTRVILWLAIIHGLISGLYWLETMRAFYPETHLGLLYGISLIGGAIVGVIQLYLVSWLYSFCGRWIGGQGRYREVKCAVGWSFYPFIVSGILAILSSLFMELRWLQMLFGVLALVAFVWGFVILFQVITEAHRFKSGWRGFSTVIIAGLLVLGCIFVLSFIEALIL